MARLWEETDQSIKNFAWLLPSIFKVKSFDVRHPNGQDGKIIQFEYSNLSSFNEQRSDGDGRAAHWQLPTMRFKTPSPEVSTNHWHALPLRISWNHRIFHSVRLQYPLPFRIRVWIQINHSFLQLLSRLESESDPMPVSSTGSSTTSKSSLITRWHARIPILFQ